MNLVEVATVKPYQVRIDSGAIHELADWLQDAKQPWYVRRPWYIWYLALVLTTP